MISHLLTLVWEGANTRVKPERKLRTEVVINVGAEAATWKKYQAQHLAK